MAYFSSVSWVVFHSVTYDMYRYGVGYHMVVTKEAKCDTSTVIQVVTSTIAGAEMVTVVCTYLCSSCSIMDSGGTTLF